MMEIKSLRQIQNRCRMWHKYLCFSSHYITTYSSAVHNVAIHYNTTHMAKNVVLVFPSLKGQQEKLRT
jgi:hypothetical protein